MTRADFLAAILANPDDDNLRLVYADWLDDRGEGERAELIRVQVELAGLSIATVEGRIVKCTPTSVVALVSLDAEMPTGVCVVRHQQRDDSWWTSQPLRVDHVEEWDSGRARVFFVPDERATALLARQGALLDAHGPRWLRDEVLIPAGLWVTDNVSFICPVRARDWRRGFVEVLSVPWKSWKVKGAALASTTPLRELELFDIEGGSPEDWQTPALRRLKRLGVRGACRHVDGHYLLSSIPDTGVISRLINGPDNSLAGVRVEAC
jgi:uncharacterized protein (TIGR02996 family)